MRLGSESGPGAGPALQAVLFDLDDTLFDHAHATRSALAALRDVEPSVAAWSLDEFVDRHDVILEVNGVAVRTVSDVRRTTQLKWNWLRIWDRQTGTTAEYKIYLN